MRTTLSLDDDVAAMIAAEERRTHKSFKQIVNEALRRSLAPRGRRREQGYEVPVHKARLAAGIDAAGFNRLADEFEQDGQLGRLTNK